MFSSVKYQRLYDGEVHNTTGRLMHFPVNRRSLSKILIILLISLLIFAGSIQLVGIFINTDVNVKVQTSTGRSWTGRSTQSTKHSTNATTLMIKQTHNIYRKHRSTWNINCKRVLDKDLNYIKWLQTHRIELKSIPNLSMTCKDIRSRIMPFDNFRPIEFGVAFARVVYSDYYLMEHHLRVSYHPQNVFCFIVDRKTKAFFYEKMLKMANCLPNVFVILSSHSIESSGAGMNRAHMDCLDLLLKKGGHSWNYVLLLQNNDIITKSIYELVEIYKTLNGANDIEITPEIGRLNHTLKWDAQSLKLFRNESNVSNKQLTTPLNFAKGAVQGSVSRKAVEWLIRTVDMSELLERIDTITFGGDEQFIQLFHVSDFLEMPGHFTNECLKKNINTDFISRFSLWYDEKKCLTNHMRHAICVLGIEHLNFIAQMPNIMFNKVMTDFDFGIVDCLGELLLNRTHLNQNDHPLETGYYSNMVNVQYHNNRHKPGFKLNCTPSYKPWEKRINDYKLF